ncbi:MAG TPA: diadenylate cyclase CdaA [Gemmatimonadaceae bacterium]|nr:diadenylate cyclase CdaA [Gemmatimonadaceae bacterium]
MTFLEHLRLLRPDWRDAIEVAIVAFALYRVMLLFHGTRAAQILIGIVLLVFAYALALVLKLTMITYLLGLIFTYGAFAAVVIFQPELRAALAHLGQAPVSRLFHHLHDTEVAEAIADALERLQRSGTGAIIALEREVSLGEYLESGSPMDAKVSADLLTTIFTPYSPLHDGAVIISGDTIIGAGCILPLSQATLSDRSLGTRHRAALGLSEETDALVLVVSEETGIISMANAGSLMRELSATRVRELLTRRPARSSAEIRQIETA